MATMKERHKIPHFQYSGGIWYCYRAFDGGANARKVLEYNLSDKAAADREQVVTLLGEGKTLDEAAGGFISEEAFDGWFQEVKQKLESSVAVSKGEEAKQ